MKSTVCLMLLIVLLFPAIPVCASPEPVSETVVITFASDMRIAVPDPAGRWMDELFQMLTIRAERLTWDDGQLTEIFFLLRDEQACSVGLLQLENDIFACGSLLPEGPVPLSGPQREIMVSWPASLFMPKGEDGRARHSLGIQEFSAAMRRVADTCIELKVDPDEHAMLDAVATLLRALSDTVIESGEKRTLLVIEMENTETVDEYNGEDIDLDMLDGLAEMLLTRFVQSMVYTLARLDD